MYPIGMCRYISIHLKLCMFQGCSLYSVYSSKTLGTTLMPINKGLIKYTTVHPWNGKQCTLETNEKTLQWLFKALQNTWQKKKKKQETDTVCQHSCKKVRRKIMYFQLYLPKRNSKRTYQKIIKALPEKNKIK